MPHASVAKGKSEADNEIVKIVDNIPQKHENDLPHWELARKYDLIDFETGVKITGAGFPLYKGLGCYMRIPLRNIKLRHLAHRLAPFRHIDRTWHGGYGRGMYRWKLQRIAS